MVVTHSAPLLSALGEAFPGLAEVASGREEGDTFAGLDDAPPVPGEVPPARLARLVKDRGEIRVEGQGLMTTPTLEEGHR